MAPTVNVKPAAKPAAGATPPAADSNAAPDASDASETTETTAAAPEAAPFVNDDILAERKRAEQAKAEGPGHLVVVAKNARFRCPQTGIDFQEDQKVALKKPVMEDKSYNWIKSQIAAGVLTVVQETDSDDAVPDLR